MDLFEHVVAIVALVDVVAVQRHAHGRADDVLVRDTPHRHVVGGDLDQIAFFQEYEAVGDRTQRQHVGREKVLANTDADHQRAADARTDQSIGLVARDHTDGVRTFELFRREAHGVDQRSAVGLQRLDQVRDDFRVGFRIEAITLRLQLFTDLLEVFDDAVVHDADAVARHVRVRIALDRRAVSRPARVRDAHVAQ